MIVSAWVKDNLLCSFTFPRTHVSQISKEHIEKPSEVLKIGQEIEAKVVDLNIEEHKISLSIKVLLADAEPVEETEETEAEESVEAVEE